jgi:uncharacterized protein YkwD
VNHRRSVGGYHSLLALGTFGAVLVQACAPVRLSPPQPARTVTDSPGDPWRPERAAVVAQINGARAELSLPPLAYDSTLERVGDLHCRILIDEGGDGHFSRGGVPPYLRYLLAGGSGFHGENVGSYWTTGTVADSALARILSTSVEDMLAEVPPNDGHRRSLLDPWVTNVGVGLAVRGGEVRMTHELATEVTQSWAPPPSAAAPGTLMSLSGRLAKPWQPEAVEVLWEELPRPLSDAQLRAIRAYGYPERRSMFHANRSSTPNSTPAFTVDGFGSFRYRWTTGPHEGVEIVLLWARHGVGRQLVPVAVSGTVVVAKAELPPELALWQGLGGSTTRP